MSRPLSAGRTLLWLLIVAAGAGCDSLRRYLSQSPEDRLVEEAVAQWTQRGRLFLDGAAGLDTVASVTPTGARGWEVAVGPPGGGLPSVWTLEIPRAAVYPCFPGDAFATWLNARAREGGMDGIPEDVVDAIRSGDLRAVGDLEVRYGAASRTARTTVEREAYLVPRPYSDETEWHVQPDTSTARMLVQAMELAVDHLVRGDPRMRDCVGTRAPAADRTLRLRCFTEVVTRRFGPG